MSLRYSFLQESGSEFVINGERHKVYGTVAAVSADNLGSLLLGGFKKSCSAYRCCRQCMATQESARTKVSNFKALHDEYISK